MNLSTARRASVLAFVAGLVGACGFAPLGLWPLTIAAFAFLLWLVETAPSLRAALGRGYWFGVGHFVLGLNWIATAFTFQAKMPSWLGWIAVVLLSLYLAVYPAMAAGLAWRWGLSRAPAEAGAQPGESAGLPLSWEHVRFILIFAAAWIVTEWLRASMFTGFAWNPEGVVLIDSWTSAAARYVGTYGLSGIVMLLSGITYALVLGRGRLRFALLAGLFLVVLIDLRLVDSDAAAAPDAIPLRIVQPNIGQQDKWRPGFEELNFLRHARLSRQKTEAPRLLLWPEAAVVSPLQDARSARRLAQLDARFTRLSVASVLVPNELLLTGGVTYRSTDGRRLTSATNSVFAMDARGRILGRYDKSHLVPYGEYLPARPILSAIGLSRLAPGDVDFDSGPGPRTIDLPLVGKVGFQLCYEIIFSGHVVEEGNRPRFLFNPSNDAWFGFWGPPQHLAQARLRALEEGLPVLRATPTGISAVIDADGRITHSLPWRRAGVIDAMLPAPHAPTLFARLGNIVPFLFALTLVAVAMVRRPR